MHIPRPAQKSKAVSPRRSSTPLENPSFSLQLELFKPIKYKSKPNQFSVFRVYKHLPQQDPEERNSLLDLCDSLNFGVSDEPCTSTSVAFGIKKRQENIYVPFKNSMVFCLMAWHHNPHLNLKSVSETNHLVKDVINNSEFNASHLEDFNFAREAHRLDEATNAVNNPFLAQDQ